ncbi:MAG: hypothetical protein HGA67_02080 [Candidatus Yonathbacteria bacterium]|nr:hypothetical protein [Candidatus Yonathbacteria bacterium]
MSTKVLYKKGVADAIFAFLHDNGRSCSASFIEEVLRSKSHQHETLGFDELSTAEEIEAIGCITARCVSLKDFSSEWELLKKNFSPTMRRVHERNFMKAWIDRCSNPEDIRGVLKMFLKEQQIDHILQMIVRKMEKFPLPSSDMDEQRKIRSTE